MPLFRGSRYALLGGLEPVRYRLWDEFISDESAPITSPRTAQPGPGIGTIRDIELKIALASGWAEFTVQASPVYAEQDLVYAIPALSRVPGLIIIGQWRCTTDGPQYPLALVDSATPAWNHTNVRAAFWRSSALTLSVVNNLAVGPAVAAFVADGTIYSLAIVLRSAGAKFYIKGGAFTYWTKLYETVLDATATLYLAAAGYTAAFGLNFLRGPIPRWLDSPLLYLTGAMTWATTDGYAGDGGLGAGGGGLVMLDPGTWATAGGLVANTPVLGVEVVTDPAFNSAGDWTAGAGWTVGGGVATKIATGGFVSVVNSAGPPTITGSWHGCSVDVVRNAGNVYFGLGNLGNAHSLTGSYYETMRAINTNKCMGYGNSAFVGTIDNLSVKLLPISNLITNVQLTTTDVLAEQVIHAYTLGTQIGMILNADRSFAAKCAATAAAGQAVIALKEVTGVGGVGLTTNDTITVGGLTYTIASITGGSNVAYDDVAKTQTITLGTNLGSQVNVDDKVGLDWASWNGVLFYFDGLGNIKLDEVKAGVYTNRMSVATTFVADNRLIVRKIGTEYRGIFNEALVGTTTAVAAAAMAGKYHGMFSTYELNTITSMVVYASGSNEEYNILDRF